MVFETLTALLYINAGGSLSGGAYYAPPTLVGARSGATSFVKVNEELLQKVVDSRASRISDSTTKPTNSDLRMYLGVSLAIYEEMKSWAAGECDEVEPFGHVVTGPFEYRWDRVEAMDVERSSGWALITNVSPHLRLPSGDMYTPSVSSVEEGITNRAKPELQHVEWAEL